MIVPKTHRTTVELYSSTTPVLRTCDFNPNYTCDLHVWTHHTCDFRLHTCDLHTWSTHTCEFTNCTCVLAILIQTILTIFMLDLKHTCDFRSCTCDY